MTMITFGFTSMLFIGYASFSNCKVTFNHNSPATVLAAQYVTEGILKKNVCIVLGCQPGDYSTIPVFAPEATEYTTTRASYVWWENNFISIGVLFDEEDIAVSIVSYRRFPKSSALDH